MGLDLDDYLHRIEECRRHAASSSDAATAKIWRQLAENYQMLIELKQRDLRNGALIAPT